MESSSPPDHKQDKNDVGVISELSLQERALRRRINKYHVVLLNDDFTPMDLVVHILQKFFHKSVDEATEIMLAVHHEGAAVCGVYPFDIAETKVTQVITFARRQGSPLRCRIDKLD